MPQTPKTPSAGQRETLRRSQRKATEQEPQNFRDESNADKTVEVGPDMTDKPIEGVDPPEHGRKER